MSAALFSPAPGKTNDRELREVIGEACWYVRHYAEMAERYAILADDVLLAATLTRISTYHRAAVDTLRELNAATTLEGERHA